jgi:hypothetical protein
VKKNIEEEKEKCFVKMVLFLALYRIPKEPMWPLIEFLFSFSFSFFFFFFGCLSKC